MARVNKTQDGLAVLVRGGKREVCRLLFKVVQRYVQRQQRQLFRLAKDPHLSAHRRHPHDDSREQSNKGDQ